MSTKKELIASIAEQTNLSKKDVEAVLDIYTDTIVKALEGGEVAKIHNVGTLKVQDRAARKGRNPKTGEVIDIPASKRVSFSISQHLKTIVKK